MTSSFFRLGLKDPVLCSGTHSDSWYGVPSPLAMTSIGLAVDAATSQASKINKTTVTTIHQLP